MVKRAATAKQTREQIVAATVEAHRELGIQATSWDEIARRAGVGVGTVYRHFPSLNELLPACGEMVEQTMALPAPDDIAHAFDGVRSSRARIDLLVELVFAIYERAEPFIHNIRSEREQLPQLEPWHQMIENTLDALLNEALGALNPSRPQRESARALLDLSTWRAFQRRALSPRETTESVTRLIYSAVR
ncbi:MAG: TetR/AcrR family transcriptional regulator [Solirubrobacteraceae bacterium]